MTTPTTNISLSDIQTEFGGASPIGMDEYYRGGANVPSGTAAGTSGVLIATSGAINVGDFRSVTKVVSVPMTMTSASLGVQASGYMAGTPNKGSLVPNNGHKGIVIYEIGDWSNQGIFEIVFEGLTWDATLFNTFRIVGFQVGDVTLQQSDFTIVHQYGSTYYKKTPRTFTIPNGYTYTITFA